MIHRLILVPAFLVLIGCSAQANAGLLSFTSKETIRFAANTGITLENGHTVYLGRRVTLKSFILPYRLEDNGYVLADKEEPGKYYPLPAGPKLKTLQENGFLPKPLPPFHFRFGDYLVGYAVWWLLLLIVLVPALIKKALARRDYGEEEEF